MKPSRSGLTLLELLVVLGIIALLVALLIPAVQSAREASRRLQCRNNLRQQGLAMQNHLSAYGRFPGNGWGYLWFGDPDRGTDRRQPGGWIYNILPYLEQQAAREAGKGEPAPQQRTTLAGLAQQSFPMFRCPTRPGSLLSPAKPENLPYNADWISPVFKTDYAVNEGDYITDTTRGPATLVEGDDPGYLWTDATKATGVCFLRSEIRPAEITDGMSNTYLIGEKYISSASYEYADDAGFDQSLLSGVDLDLNRWTFRTPHAHSEEKDVRSFGSAHSQGCHFVFCDGSVRVISYHIDQEIHRRLGNRMDGLPTDGISP